MLTADDRVGYDLARRIKDDLLDQVPQPNYAHIVLACCWLLADVITQQARAADGMAVDEATALIATKVLQLADALTVAQAEADAVTH